MTTQHQEGRTDELVGAAPVDLGHQALRRQVNDQIHRINRRLNAVDLGTMDVMCECVHTDCMGLVVIPVLEYEALRELPGRFLVKPGHEVPNAELVVASSDGHVIVERSGKGRLQPVRADARMEGSA